jgi:hypothetical protein
MKEGNLRGKRVQRRLHEVQEQKEGRAMAMAAGSLVSLSPTLSLSLSRSSPGIPVTSHFQPVFFGWLDIWPSVF